MSGDFKRFQVALIMECRKINDADEDRAKLKNCIGWSQCDSPFFHKLLDQDIPGEWYPYDIWKMFEKLSHYHRQFEELEIDWDRLVRLSELAKIEEKARAEEIDRRRREEDLRLMGCY